MGHIAASDTLEKNTGHSLAQGLPVNSSHDQLVTCDGLTF